MSRMSTSHIAVLLAIGAIVPMQSFVSRPGLAETLGNAEAKGFAAIGISDSHAGPAHATAIGGIAVGPDSQAFTQDATHPCAGGSDATDCGQGNISIGTSSGDRGLAGADRGGAAGMRPAGAHRARERRISGDWRIRNESPSAIHSMSKDVRFEQKQIFAPSLSEVRFVPQSGHRGLASYVRSVPIADINRITAVAPSGVARARHEIRCCRGLQSTNARSRSR